MSSPWFECNYEWNEERMEIMSQEQAAVTKPVLMWAGGVHNCHMPLPHHGVH